MPITERAAASESSFDPLRPSLARPTPVEHGSLHGACDHLVQFYEKEEYLYDVVAEFLGAGFEVGEPLLVIATEAHRQSFCQKLLAKGFDVTGALNSGQLTLLDARECLAQSMVQGTPDWELFRRRIGGEVAKARGGHSRIRAYGEMVDLLWRDGNPKAAIRLEELWNDLSQTQSFSLLCAYVMGNFFREAHTGQFEQICRTHTHVSPAETYPKNQPVDVRNLEISLLQQRALALEAEVEERKQLEKALREALAENRRQSEALRSSQAELSDFLENAIEGIHAVGADGIIQWANRAELELLGYSREEYIGHHISEFYVDRNTIENILLRLGRNEVLRDAEARLRRKDGSIRTVLIHSNVFFREGKFIHTRCFTRDITDRKQLEDELKQQNEELERTLRFNEMFVGILGHDLRNPLSAIRTAANLLVRRVDNEKLEKPLRRILNSSGRMARMIDQLLDFTCIRLGKGLPLNRRSLNLAEICQFVIDELDGNEQSTRVRFTLAGDVGGYWDGDKLAQLISNLVGNALTHGDSSIPVTIHLDGLEARELRLEVHNAGVIPPEVIPFIFEPFKSPVNKKQQGSSGLGLGLYISLQVVKAHLGEIRVSSSLTEGTRFIVRLPRGASGGGPIEV